MQKNMENYWVVPANKIKPPYENEVTSPYLLCHPKKAVSL